MDKIWEDLIEHMVNLECWGKVTRRIVKSKVHLELKEHSELEVKNQMRD